jgi:hypothetical protein
VGCADCETAVAQPVIASSGRMMNWRTADFPLDGPS